MPKKVDIKDRIIDTALALAEARSWEAVRLHDVGAALDLSLNDIRAHFREKEELVEAWFDRADRAMLEDAATAEFQALPARQRVHRAIMTWLAALAPHRKVTREMIWGKLEPGHLHVQIPALMRISRTVQWLREAAHRDVTFLRRALEETGLTTIYLMTFFYWMRDESGNAVRTSQFLDRLLTNAETLSHRVYGYSRAAQSGTINNG
ncbi:MAG: TetR/AcrR family transcriptional regulator [Acidiferrobacterales bacterium]